MSPRGAGPRALRAAVLLAAVFVAAWASLFDVEAASLVPMMWPAVGLAVGLLLTTPASWRHPLAAAIFVVVLGAHLVQGVPPDVALGFSLGTVAAALLVRRRLVAGRRRAALLDHGDVSSLVAAITLGSLLAATVCGVTALLTGHGDPWLGALAAFGGYAASLMVLLPLFLETPVVEALAGRRERLVQLALTVGTSVIVFVFADAPPVVFAVMPMFAWHAFRGAMREATLLLTLVGVIGTGLTLAEVGPLWALGEHYGLAPELAGGVLALFLVDCGLILLPLSVMVSQQRMASTRADAGRETLERLVAAATGTAVLATGHDGRLVLFNPGAEAMLGCTAEEALGELPDRFYPVEELERQSAELGAGPTFADICRASVARSEPQRLWRFRGSSGELRTMRMTLTAIPDELGELSGYLATAEDVTEREAAHRALVATLGHERSAAERLRELDRVKGDFVATVSHELRTPITSIVGYTQLLVAGEVGELTASQQEIVGRVERNSRRLQQLVEDLLTLSEIESATLRIEPVTTDLCDVVTNAHDSLGPSLAQRALAVTVQVPGEPVVHRGDPAQLERMVKHLLTNAVKFTPDGGAIDVVLRERGDGCEIVVSDTGIGIPEAEQARLFTRFFRSASAGLHAIQGAGLGLTIVRALVTLHGGDIRVDSAVGEGTTVTVTLPGRIAHARDGSMVVA